MEGDQSRLSELAISDRQDSIFQINVIKLQPNGFAKTQPRYREKTKEAVVRPPRPFVPPVSRRAQEPLDFVVTIYVRPRTWVFGASRPSCGTSFRLSKIAAYLANLMYHGKSPLRLALSPSLGPVESQARRDVRDFSLFDKGKEARQCSALVQHLESQTAT